MQIVQAQVCLSQRFWKLDQTCGKIQGEEHRTLLCLYPRHSTSVGISTHHVAWLICVTAFFLHTKSQNVHTSLVFVKYESLTCNTLCGSDPCG